MDWSYVAGYFDGEGHVSLHPMKRGDMMRALTWYNTHYESLQAMQLFMGCGHINVRNQSNRNNPVYALVVGRKADLLHVLDNMIPHLIVKRDAAENLRCFLADVREMTPNFGKMAAITDEQLQQWYYDEHKSFSDIAKIVGVSVSAVGQAMRVRGFKSRPAGGEFMKGVPKSDETKMRMKKSRREMWENPEFREAQLVNLAKGREKLNAKREAKAE